MADLNGNLGENIFTNDPLTLKLQVSNATACNYNAEATEDDGPRVYVDGICDTCENGIIIDNDADDDEICDEIDNCPETFNPDQDDFNNDNIGDACDGIGIDEIDQVYNLSLIQVTNI